MVQDGGVRLSMGTTSQRMSNSNHPVAHNYQTGAAEDRIHSDCINLGTKSHEEEQEAIRRSTKSAGRVRAKVNMQK